MVDRRGELAEGDTPLVSIVCPMFNEAQGIRQFLEELQTTMAASGRQYEVILVDDGSSDDSVAVALGFHWRECRVLSLARNVGHQIALEAGLAVAQGRWIVTMDADGQHPPDVVERMLCTAITGDVDVVYAIQSQRRRDSVGKRWSALGYYRAVRFLTGVPVENSQADFRLMSSDVLEDLKRVPGDKVLRLLLPAVGYRSTKIRYEVRERFAGKGRFGLRRQIRMASSSLLNFSARPLRLVAAVGGLLSLGAFAWLVYVLIAYISTRAIQGWSSVMAAVLVVGGLTLLSVSIVGEYVARIHDLLRAHPRYAARWASAEINST